MAGVDLFIAMSYLAGFIATAYPAFFVFAMASMFSMAIASAANAFVNVEYMYFLMQSMVWVVPALIMRNNIKLALCSLTMCVYEWLVAIESFIWQFIVPVESFLYSEYMFIVIAIHLFILSTSAKWGGESGYNNRIDIHSRIFLSDL